MEINVEQLMAAAVTEMKNKQYAAATKKFDTVVTFDPTNIDAPFFRAYCGTHDITIGEMRNASIYFSSAFLRYVDDVKALNNPNAEREKLDFAVELMEELVSDYRYNAKGTALTAPSVGMGLSTAASNVHIECVKKLRDVNANISKDLAELDNKQAKSANKTMFWLALLVCLGVGTFLLSLLWIYLF